MSQDVYMLDMAFIASTNLSSYQYQLATPDASTGDHYVDVNSTANGLVYGVVYDKPKTNGASATLRVHGTAKIVADATVDAGVAVFASSNGKSYAGASTGYVVGMALESAGATDEVIEVLLTPGNYLK